MSFIGVALRFFRPPLFGYQRVTCTLCGGQYRLSVLPAFVSDIFLVDVVFGKSGRLVHLVPFDDFGQSDLLQLSTLPVIQNLAISTPCNFSTKPCHDISREVMQKMSETTITAQFEEIYSSTQKMTHAYIAARCRHTADISDIFQETYMELYRVMQKRGADYIANESAFVLWLAKKKLARHYTLLTRLNIFVSLKTVSGDDQAYDFDEVEAFATEDFATTHTNLIAARELIESCPDVVQKIFYLHYEVGLTIAEVADALSLKESNVKSKLYRTLKALRNLLE